VQVILFSGRAPTKGWQRERLLFPPCLRRDNKQKTWKREKPRVDVMRSDVVYLNNLHGRCLFLRPNNVLEGGEKT
jgi:hypothetical protein